MKNLIYLITDGTLTSQNFSAKSKNTISTIRSAIENDISLIQIREKNLPAKLVFELTVEAVKIARASSAKILVNDRADIALLARADGVHLTSVSMPPKVIRNNFPSHFMIGVSAHSLDDVQAAKNQGANFTVFSPIFATPDKGSPLGIDILKDVCEAVNPFPVIGLGGIDAGNYDSVLQVASGFAAIRFLQSHENLRKLKNENLSINRWS